jgi:rod shape-determining protein MreC
VGQVAQGTDGRLRTRLSADYERLDFLRVLRSRPAEQVRDPGGLVRPVAPFGPNLTASPEPPPAEPQGGTDG